MLLATRREKACVKQGLLLESQVSPSPENLSSHQESKNDIAESCKMIDRNSTHMFLRVSCPWQVARRTARPIQTNHLWYASLTICKTNKLSTRDQVTPVSCLSLIPFYQITVLEVDQCLVDKCQVLSFASGTDQGCVCVLVMTRIERLAGSFLGANKI